MGYPCTVKLNIYIARKENKKQAYVQLNETQNTIKKTNIYEHTKIPNYE